MIAKHLITEWTVLTLSRRTSDNTELCCSSSVEKALSFPSSLTKALTWFNFFSVWVTTWILPNLAHKFSCYLNTWIFPCSEDEQCCDQMYRTTSEVYLKKKTLAFIAHRKSHCYCRAKFLVIRIYQQFNLGTVNANFYGSEICCILT